MTTEPGSGPPKRPERGRLRISGISVVAGAAAAATASFASSWLGVAGTVVGAAVVSVVITVGTAVYDHSMRRARAQLHERNEALRLRASQRTTGEAATTSAVGVEGDRREPDEVSGPGSEADSPGDVPLAALGLEDDRGYRWERIALVSLTVFVLSMVVVTAVEIMTGRPLSAWLTGDDASGTTVGTIVHERRHPTTPTPTPTVSTTQLPSPVVTTVTPIPTPTVTVTATVSPQPTSSGTPTPAATPTPTTISPTPSATSTPRP